MFLLSVTCMFLSVICVLADVLSVLSFCLSFYLFCTSCTTDIINNNRFTFVFLKSFLRERQLERLENVQRTFTKMIISINGLRYENIN